MRGVNLRVKPKEVIVIIGPSGSGKSTFIRCINRLEEHQSGRIIIDGIELSHDLRNIQEIRRVLDEDHYGLHKVKRRIVHPQSFFYPLDGLGEWNRLYGPRGFTHCRGRRQSCASG